MIVVPAVLPSSRAEFEKDLALLTTIPSVSRIQIDVVDGRFASPASWPYTAPHDLTALAAAGAVLPAQDRLEYEIDLMCMDAGAAIETWFALGASRFTIHAGSVSDLPRLLLDVRKSYVKELTASQVSFGVALNLASDLALLEPCLDALEYVQFMGIARIGRQGQPFDLRVCEKVRVFHARHPKVPIQVDGGVSLDSAKQLLALGASSLVVGSAILGAGNPARAIAAFRALEPGA